jgi:hypothetical protein
MKDSTQNSPEKLLTLQEAAQKLNVPVEVLLQWNDHHILTPTITRTGQIGYSNEQITHFLAIKASLQSPYQTLPQQTTAQQSPRIPAVSTPAPLPVKQPTYVRPVWTLTIAAGGLLALLVATQQPKMVSLLQQAEQKTQTPPTETQTKPSLAHLDQTIALNKASKLAENADGDHLHSQTDGVFANNIFATPTPTKIPRLHPLASTKQSRVLASSSSAQSKSIQAKQSIPSPDASAQSVIADTTTLAEKTALPCPSCDNEQESQKGLNLGKAPEDSALLAAAFGTEAMNNDYSQQNLSTATTQAVVLIFGGLAGTVLFLQRRRQRQINQRIAPVAIAVTHTDDEKILEVKQKMDGTVVLCFQGKDYKISKPELDSDSDRFIERLMQLVKPGMKEIEYEGLSDSLDLTAPLSRLVTRLGFVGIKRDLFFPRTSKHRVLFRRYITAADLTAMNLTIAKVRQALALPNQG